VSLGRLLDIFNSQRRQLGSPQAATQQDGECGVVSLSAKAGNIYRPQTLAKSR
jgi:hypothetical protein